MPRADDSVVAHDRTESGMRLAPAVHAVGAAMLFLGLVASDAAGEARLLRPGQYHGDEVTAVSGERWLALMRDTTGRDRLVQVTLRVDTVRDELAVEDGRATGKLVSAASAGEIVVLLAGVPGLRAGRVTTLAADRDITPGEPVRVTLRGAAYEVILECAVPPRGVGSERAACSLVVRRRNQRQVLKRYEAQFEDRAFVAVGDDVQPKLLWAGDLDADGALDLLIDLTDHYNLSRPTLFLSRGRRNGALLGPVAKHESVGC